MGKLERAVRPLDLGAAELVGDCRRVRRAEVAAEYPLDVRTAGSTHRTRGSAREDDSRDRQKSREDRDAPLHSFTSPSDPSLPILSGRSRTIARISGPRAAAEVFQAGPPAVKTRRGGP